MNRPLGYRTRPLVSVVITLYNYEKYIRECLESVISQDLESMEIVVVNDGSTDASGNVVSSVFGGREAMFYVSQQNQGYAAAKNRGIMESSGQFICMLDADDKLLPGSLCVRASYLLDHPNVDLVHGYAMRWYGGSDIRGVNKKTYCHAQGRMWRRSAYDRLGLYYEGLRSMADKEFIYRAGVHPESPLPRLVKDKKLKVAVALYRKHDPNVQMHKYKKYVNPKLGAKHKKQFKRRIKQLKREGITRENTRWPNGN